MYYILNEYLSYLGTNQINFLEDHWHIEPLGVYFLTTEFFSLNLRRNTHFRWINGTTEKGFIQTFNNWIYDNKDFQMGKSSTWNGQDCN